MMEGIEQFWPDKSLSGWVLAIAIVAASLLAGRLLYWLLGTVLRRLALRTTTPLDDVLLDQVREPLVLSVVITGLGLGLRHLNTAESWEIWLKKGFSFALIFAITWLMIRILDTAIRFWLMPLLQRINGNFADTNLPVLISIINLLIWAAAFVFALNYIGYDVRAILAGFGIGGLAFAVAANYTLSNVIGGVTIIFSQPFRAGDRIRIDGHDGFVETIGLISTRLRTFIDDTLIVIPNRQFTEKTVVNMSNSPARRNTLRIPLSYRSSPEQLEAAIAILKQIAREHPALTDECKVAFDQFGEYALVIQFMYYVRHEAHLWDTHSEVSLEVYSRFHKAGLRFAYLRGWPPAAAL